MGSAIEEVEEPRDIIAPCDPAEQAAVAAVAEFAELLPPDSEFYVRYGECVGRYMAAAVPLPAGYDFLFEAPLVVWPLVSEMILPRYSTEALPIGSSLARSPSLLAPWCESCLCDLPDSQRGCSGVGARRRIQRKRPPGPSDRCGDPGFAMYCAACSSRLSGRTSFFTPGLLWRWRRWQAERSPGSQVGLEAFARCFAWAAAAAADARARLPGLAPGEALRASLRPFDRLASPPPGGGVTLHGTDAAEVAAELRASEPFVGAVVAAVGCPRVAAELLSEASVNALAGRLVLNAAGVEVQRGCEGGGGGGGAAAAPLPPLRAAGVFVLLSTMNHSCAATAEAVFGASSTVTLRTTRAVEAGEPLTLAYVQPTWPLAARRERLCHWFFECDCRLCETEARLGEALGR